MKKYRDLLFDLDHTLWDFDKNSLDALSELFNSYSLDGYFESFDEFNKIYHGINSMLWSQYGRGKISKETVKYGRFSRCLEKKSCYNKELARNLAEEYVKLSPCKTHLVEGAIEILEGLTGSYRMHIITNGFNEVQYKKIQLSGLMPFFEKVFTSEDAGYQKPDQGFFQFVFESNGLSPATSLVIGDNLITDIGGARDFGIDTVFYNPGGDRDFIGASYMISNMNELLPIL